MTEPTIQGFAFERLLGKGGFADVYLYERELPRSLVAVKVLRAAGLDAEARRRFTSEANVMARLSTHPSIVTILAADVTSSGQPYLVMEYYPNGNLATRSRRDRMSVPEVLRIGILISGAVETAHRAGILHRDIKPANILIGEFGNPGLTDFGIATTIADVNQGGTEELSLPWAPPEAIAGEAADASSDVYSLAATLYSLLAGRSPFEMTDDHNALADIMDRIEHSAVPALERGDVPQSFERILAQAMAKGKGLRPATPLVFARALQDVERELHLATTTIVVPEDAVAKGADAANGDSGDHRTQTVRRPSGRRQASSPPFQAQDHRWASTDEPWSSTIRRPPVLDPELSPPGTRATSGAGPTSRRIAMIAIAVVATVVVGLIVALATSSPPRRGTSPVPTVTDGAANFVTPVAPEHVRLLRHGTVVTASWSDPSARKGDGYYWQVAEDPHVPRPNTAAATRLPQSKGNSVPSKSAVALFRNIPASTGLCIRVRLWQQSTGYESHFSRWACT
ncbi:MAG: serine/threonine-protein kinase [Acidimicrobiales bacterium]